MSRGGHDAGRVEAHTTIHWFHSLAPLSFLLPNLEEKRALCRDTCLPATEYIYGGVYHAMHRMMRTSAGLFPAFSLFAAHGLLGPTFVDSAPAPAPPAPAPAPALELNISAAGPAVALSYTLSVDGVLWLQGSPLETIHVQGKETALTYTSTAEGTGDDAIGMYRSTAITWDAAGTVVVTEFREYREATPAAVVFSLQFPQGTYAYTVQMSLC